MRKSEVDVLIIGAGPSGSVAAAYLHQQGCKVKVVEKNSFPRFVIGESLLPRCMEHFEEVGLLNALNDFGFEEKHGARFMKEGVVCHFDFSKKHTDGWNWTWQVPRADFDKVLTDTLQEKGVDISFQQEVIAVEFDEDGCSRTQIKGADGVIQEISAKFVIDSSGFGRVLPRLLGLEKPSSLAVHSSMFTHVVDKNRPKGTEGTLITFDVVRDDSWIWVIPFSNGITSLGFVGPTTYLESLEGTVEERWKTLLQHSNYYYERFKDTPPLFTPYEIKNYSKAVSKLYGNGYVLTGNSAEFLDPVFSSGVTFATESALRAGKLVAKQLAGTPVNWQQDYKEYIERGVDVFRTYVKEWYTGNLQKIFFHSKENPMIKRQICAVLAGYVWDESNPFVKNHHRLVKTVAHIVDLETAPPS